MDRIRLDKVGKRFSRQKGAKLLTNWGFWREDVEGSNWFWGLKDIDLSIRGPGKRIGIIGSNGSGKTTLLRLIAGVTEPTSGKMTINGRVLPLLELFSGMQPELTGRENTYLNGIILGMHRREVHQKLDSIIDFAGIEKFFDMPVKHYSMGMMMRLGFSIATHVEGNIILVDEAWGIGDADFQTRSFKRLGELHKEGATLIVVSHSTNIIQELTDEVLWLEDGRVKEFGRTKSVLPAYEQSTKTT